MLSDVHMCWRAVTAQHVSYRLYFHMCARIDHRACVILVLVATVISFVIVCCMSVAGHVPLNGTNEYPYVHHSKHVSIV